MSKIRLRRGTTSEWAAANPVLAAGEPGVDTTTGVLKIGDGSTAWASLPTPYAAGSALTPLQAAIVPGVWTVPGFTAGWGQYGGFSLVGYRKIGDLVYLRGLLNATAGVTANAWTFPVGFRPPVQCLTACYCSPGTMRRVDITAAGLFNVSSPVNGEWYALDSIPPMSVTP
jgi:hypothetical protein